QATGGGAFPSAPQSYGIVGSGATGFGDFHFLANANCGEKITLTFHLQDGSLDLGNVTKVFTLGLLATAPAPVENFDGVTAPALPAGWTTVRSSTATGAAPLWVTSTTLRDSLPNSAFGGGSTIPTESRLTSPTMAHTHALRPR